MASTSVAPRSDPTMCSNNSRVNRDRSIPLLLFTPTIFYLWHFGWSFPLAAKFLRETTHENENWVKLCAWHSLVCTVVSPSSVFIHAILVADADTMPRMVFCVLSFRHLKESIPPYTVHIECSRYRARAEKRLRNTSEEFETVTIVGHIAHQTTSWADAERSRKKWDEKWKEKKYAKTIDH